MTAIPTLHAPAAAAALRLEPPALSPLAAAVYKAIVRRLRTRNPPLTYGQLVELLAPRHPTHQRSPALHAALTEVCLACRARGLPCLPALVHRADRARPGPAYYRAAHPRARSEAKQIEAWEAELLAVLASAERY